MDFLLEACECISGATCGCIRAPGQLCGCSPLSCECNSENDGSCSSVALSLGLMASGTVDENAFRASVDERRAVGTLTPLEATQVHLSHMERIRSGAPHPHAPITPLVEAPAPSNPWWLTREAPSVLSAVPCHVALVALIWYGGLDFASTGLLWNSFSKVLCTWIAYHERRFPRTAPRKKNYTPAWTSPCASVTKEIARLLIVTDYNAARERALYFFRFRPAVTQFISSRPTNVLSEEALFQVCSEQAKEIIDNLKER
jgi:hypothetical protein